MNMLNRTRDEAASDSGVVLGSGSDLRATKPPVPMPTGVSIEMPNLGSRSAYAATAKVAGRLNATAVSDEELERLLARRHELLDKKFDHTITRREANELAYVHWSLDRIEDARHGATLDLLEQQVLQFEALRDEVQKFQNQLASLGARKR